jgi:hypothetical protein
VIRHRAAAGPEERGKTGRDEQKAPEIDDFQIRQHRARPVGEPRRRIAEQPVIPRHQPALERRGRADEEPA